MSGWDEGNVFFSDQGQGDPTRPAPDGITPGQARRTFADFFRNFRGAPTASYPDGRLVYRDALDQDQPPRELDVLMDDLIAHDPALAKELRAHPDVYHPVLEHAAVSVVESLRDEAGANPQEGALVSGVGGAKSEFAKLEMQVHLTSNETPRALRSMNSKDVGKLVYVPGIVIAASKTRSKATRLAIQCKTCRGVKHLPLSGGYSGVQLPRYCDSGGLQGAAEGGVSGGVPEGGCGVDPFVVVPERSRFVDQQTLKLQENPEDVPAGEMPRNMALCVERNSVQKIVPGTRVRVAGVYSLHGGGGGGKGGGRDRAGAGGAAVSQPYLRVVGLTEETEGARGDAHFTDQEHTEFKAFAARPFAEVVKDIRSRIAPAIFGADDIKAAVASLLFSGARKKTPDGANLRGDVNVLLMGDPSTAKSQFLKFVEKTAPICVYTSGKGSSAAGLTASVVRDASGEFYLEGGAMVLADGGCVCIDEFDKMRDEDRVAIHEAMEQQTISIAKAGITTVLNSRAAVLAAANPPSGRYDDLKTAQENIDLQTTILSRFDLIFIVRDERLYERDVAIADHVLAIHAGGGDETGSTDPNEQNPERERAQKFLKRYVEYCRATCSPRLQPASAKLLEDQYVKYRQEMRERAKRGGAPAVPITVRQLEAITRVSESLAKMCLQRRVTEEHVQEALRLFEVSTVDAARSGVAEMVVLTPEQREELSLVETQIKQKLAIGATASKRHLVEDLARVGVNEWAVMRALMIMAGRGEVQERAEGRRVTRVH